MAVASFLQAWRPNIDITVGDSGIADCCSCLLLIKRGSGAGDRLSGRCLTGIISPTHEPSLVWAAALVPDLANVRRCQGTELTSAMGLYVFKPV